MSADRDLDVVVFGATGFVGRLTAAYLAGGAAGEARVGLAGRSRERLEGLRASLGSGAADWPLLAVDSSDAAAMKELAGAARVVATTVGPYRKYGLPLVEACAEAGTDYADLTGEPLFMRETIERFHDVAARSGARIVHTCGFDSIPSDLGVFLLYERAQADGAGELEDTTFALRAAKGSFSGGTLASLTGQLDEIRAERHLAKVIMDPYALSPDRSSEPDLGDERDLRGVRHDDDLGMWQAPFAMASINTRVVRRSNALQGHAYGRRLRYREVMGFSDSLQGRASAVAVAAGTGALVGGLAFGPTRAVLERFLPSPGEGPSEKTQRTGFFRIDVHTRTSSGRRYVCRISAPGDPGYAATAVMLGQAALCLAQDRDRLPARAGVLTPSTAMGDALVERLRAAGHTYEVEAE
jgi:short subunit dehydrogenase-like uncharacterized protein